MDSQQPRDVFCIDLVKLNAFLVERVVCNVKSRQDDGRIKLPRDKNDAFLNNSIYCYVQGGDFGHAIPFETVWNLTEDEFSKLFFVKKDKYQIGSICDMLHAVIPTCIFVVDDYPEFDFEAAINKAQICWEKTGCSPEEMDRMCREAWYVEFKAEGSSTASKEQLTMEILHQETQPETQPAQPGYTRYIVRTQLCQLFEEVLSITDRAERNMKLTTGILPMLNLQDDRVGIYHKAQLEVESKDLALNDKFLDLRNVKYMTDADIIRFTRLNLPYDTYRGYDIPEPIWHGCYLLRVAADTLDGTLQRDENHQKKCTGAKRDSMPAEVADQLAHASLQRLRVEVEYLYSIRHRELGTRMMDSFTLSDTLNKLTEEVDEKIKDTIERSNSVITATENDATDE